MPSDTVRFGLVVSFGSCTRRALPPSIPDDVTNCVFQVVYASCTCAAETVVGEMHGEPPSGVDTKPPSGRPPELPLLEEAPDEPLDAPPPDPPPEGPPDDPEEEAASPRDAPLDPASPDVAPA